MLNVNEDLLKNAVYFAKLGFTVFKVNGKVPLKGLQWRDHPYTLPSQVEEHFNEAHYAWDEETEEDELVPWSGNYALAPDKNQLVIDIDPRSFRCLNCGLTRNPKAKKNCACENPNWDTPHVRLFEQIGISLKDFTTVVQTGGGGLHVYLRLPDLPDGCKVRKNHPSYKGIDFLSDGAYAVGAGSIHPITLDPYKVLHENPMGTAPQALIDIITSKALDTNLPSLLDGTINVDEDPQTLSRYTEYLANHSGAVEGDNGDLITYTVACRGRDLGLSAEKAFDLMAEHFNPKCAPEWPLEEVIMSISA